MTIQIPEDLVRGLEGAAAMQSKSVEQVAIESLRLAFDSGASPQAILQALKSLPHPSAAAVDDMEAAIREARIPVRDEVFFDRSPQG